jgi:hypothetical protein
MGKKSGSGSGMNIPDHNSESIGTIFVVKIVNFFDKDPDPGSGNLFDPGSGDRKYSDPGCLSRNTGREHRTF